MILDNGNKWIMGATYFIMQYIMHSFRVLLFSFLLFNQNFKKYISITYLKHILIIISLIRIRESIKLSRRYFYFYSIINSFRNKRQV